MRWYEEMREDQQDQLLAGLVASALTLPAAWLVQLWLKALVAEAAALL